MRRNLFLYLAIACFIGLIAIFIFDGYIGIYDTVYITTGEREQQVDPDYWQRQLRGYSYPYHIEATGGESVHFRYEIDNRRFSTYSATVEASVWKSNEKVVDLLSQDISVSAFDKVTMEWTLPTDMLEKPAVGVALEYTVKIKRGEMELGQGIILSFYSLVEPMVKLVPPPSG